MRHCIFLIDDFASELDQTKRSLLAERLQNSGSQVFVTAITQNQLNEMQYIQDGLRIKNVTGKYVHWTAGNFASSVFTICL